MREVDASGYLFSYIPFAFAFARARDGALRDSDTFFPARRRRGLLFFVSPPTSCSFQITIEFLRVICTRRRSAAACVVNPQSMLHRSTTPAPRPPASPAPASPEPTCRWLCRTTATPPRVRGFDPRVRRPRSSNPDRIRTRSSPSRSAPPGRRRSTPTSPRGGGGAGPRRSPRGFPPPRRHPRRHPRRLHPHHARRRRPRRLETSTRRPWCPAPDRRRATPGAKKQNTTTATTGIEPTPSRSARSCPRGAHR
mmetsp:Transcript_1567/g.6140  ORF Transcript_1567/g.6140 Transcript_1567/m.6140 type:complete len:252 (+) Transcript_1567:1692-2447(+)